VDLSLWVDLWYFIPEASKEAVTNLHTTPEDHDLTWEQMTTGGHCFLEYTQWLGWPEKHIKALALFFHNIEMSEYRERKIGEETLLLYQARVRLDWHDAFLQTSQLCMCFF
jgi:hypothetical protein